MKHVVVTAGPVYGRLDDNKLVSNRVRGVWALRFAGYLSAKGYRVTLVLPDTMPKNSDLDLGTYPSGVPIKVRRHTGFESYQALCNELAADADSMILAAAVVNWIPAFPYEGKMPTKGFKEGDIIQIPFVLAPHVIDQMKVANPKLTLIGCKMLVNAPEDDLIEAAYGVLLKARCNAVVANDMGKGLKRKLVVNQDRTVQEYNDDFDGFYANLLGHIEDEHYSTEWRQTSDAVAESGDVFDAVIEKYRGRFTKRQVESDKVFGAVFTPTGDIALGLVSPREKGTMFSARDAVVLEAVSLSAREVCVTGPNKATLNAPLLARVSDKYPEATAILHLHEQLPGVPTVPYAPPGTVRDNEREIPGPVFNIEGHGFIACLDSNFDIWSL